ncbi:hypothetical protein LUZ60_001387 [Juncus effusus]|nr:hypothetical protein LUZ60_001387 [Juncus effusus]
MAEVLWDLSQPIDVRQLDATVAAFHGTRPEKSAAADSALRELQNNPDMWLQVVHILQNSQSPNTKIFALQVMESVIKSRWNELPVGQRDRIKNYIFNLIVQLSSNEVSFQRERLQIKNLNIILVKVLKHEWPAKWTKFVPDLVLAAKSSKTICENSMAILKLFSEEVSDSSRAKMTQQRIKELKQSFNSKCQLIHELSSNVLSLSQTSELIHAKLATLHIPVVSYSNLSLQCLLEVAALQFGDLYDVQYVEVYTTFMMQLQNILPPDSNIHDAYVNGSAEERTFIRNLALFFTSFYKAHIRVLETAPENRSALLSGLGYLIGISYVDDHEVFKVCLEYWHIFVLEFSEAHHQMEPAAAVAMMAPQQQVIPGMVDRLSSTIMRRRQMYSGPLSKLREVLIGHMAKPDEILIIEEKNRNAGQETTKNLNILVHQYKIMRQTLFCLALFDPMDTEQQMLQQLSKHLNGEDCNSNNLNALCWAIGSISGSMMEDQENRFLLIVIRDLLYSRKSTEGKENEIVNIAINTMHLVGEYPSFLRPHWKLLKTVVYKLFEFMHKTHPCVQDMACCTFLKIVHKCRHEFLYVKDGEDEPFVSELLTRLPTTIADLKPHQIYHFYESVGHIIQAESHVGTRDEYIKKLVDLPNKEWARIIGWTSSFSIEELKSVDVIGTRKVDVIRTMCRNVINILQINTSLCSALGPFFFPQFSSIFLDVLTVYIMYSEIVSNAIKRYRAPCTRFPFIKQFRSLKRATLSLIQKFLDKAEEHQLHTDNQFVRPIRAVLEDYAGSVPEVREPEVLSLYATIINRYKDAIIQRLPRVFDGLLQHTFKMVTTEHRLNLGYQEHMLNFLSLVGAIGAHCFEALSSEQLKLVMDSINWAVRDIERDIAETGLRILLELLKNFEMSESCNRFYVAYFLKIEQGIFAVLSDALHKHGFKLHVSVIQHLFCLLESERLTEPLWDATSDYFPDNITFVKYNTRRLLEASFPNTTPDEVTRFVDELFELKLNLPAFKNYIRDFLVHSEEFSAQDNKDLYAEEVAAQREREREANSTFGSWPHCS